MNGTIRSGIGDLADGRRGGDGADRRGALHLAAPPNFVDFWSTAYAAIDD